MSLLTNNATQSLSHCIVESSVAQSQVVQLTCVHWGVAASAIIVDIKHHKRCLWECFYVWLLRVWMATGFVWLRHEAFPETLLMECLTPWHDDEQSATAICYMQLVMQFVYEGIAYPANPRSGVANASIGAHTSAKYNRGTNFRVIPYL